MSRQASFFVAGALALAALLAGCLADEPETATPPDDNAPPEAPVAPGTGTGAGTGSGAGGVATPGPAVCTPALMAVASWSHDPMSLPDPTAWDPASADPVALLSASGTAAFDVAAGAQRLVFAGSAGDHVAAEWEVAVLDPAGAAVFTMGGSGPAAGSVTGDGPMESSGDIATPLAGAYTVAWRVAGYLAEASLTIEAETCA